MKIPFSLFLTKYFINNFDIYLFDATMGLVQKLNRNALIQKIKALVSNYSFINNLFLSCSPLSPM